MSINITLDQSSLDEVDKLTQQVIDNAGKAIAEQLVNLVENILAEARSNLQNNSSVVTGELVGSLKIFDVTENSVEFGSDLPYAAYVEFGRGPVNPVNKKFLHFFTKDGKEVFTKHVGPAEPRPFLEPAILRYLPRFGDQLAADERISPADAK